MNFRNNIKPCEVVEFFQPYWPTSSETLFFYLSKNNVFFASFAHFKVKNERISYASKIPVAFKLSLRCFLDRIDISKNIEPFEIVEFSQPYWPKTPNRFFYLSKNHVFFAIFAHFKVKR